MHPLAARFGWLAVVTFRVMQVEDFARSYGTKTNEELLRLAMDSEQLTSEAIAALTSELAKRGINRAERLKAFREEEQQHEDEQAKNPGSLFFLRPYGIGRKRFGKADLVYSPETGMERFRTTVFVVLLWLPLIPTGTYLVERKREFLSDQMVVLERLLLDWEQVLKVWIVAAAALLTLIWAVKLLPRFIHT